MGNTTNTSSKNTKSALHITYPIPLRQPRRECKLQELVLSTNMLSLHVVTYWLLPSTFNNTRPSAIYHKISYKLAEPTKNVFLVKVALLIKLIKEFI